jgi:hypothetical protein
MFATVATHSRVIMLDLRTLGLGVVAFGATFAVGWWFGLGKATPAFDAKGQKSPPPLATPVSATNPPTRPAAPVIEIKPLWGGPPAPAKASLPQAQGKGLTDNDGLRRSVILRAKAYQRPVCNQDSKSLYVIAATRYAETLTRAAGCNNFPKCPMGMGMLDDVWRLNRSAADIPVAEAMAAAHATGGLSEKSFRADVGRAVRVIAGADFNSGPRPQCESSSSRSRRWRVRIRFRR